MKRVAIVADHSVVVHGIRLALRHTSGFAAAGVVDGRGPVHGPLAAIAPDVVLIDDMAGTNGSRGRDRELAVARMREAEQAVPHAHRLLLTTSMDPDWMDEAFDAGIHSVLSKSVHAVGLGTMLRELVRGNVIHGRPPRAAEVAADCPLTLREREILGLVAGGATNRQIAALLWVTEQTVKFHLSNTYRKLGVANRTEASRYAHLHNFVPAAGTVAC